MNWTVEFFNETVREEFLQLPPDVRADLVRISEMIRDFGLEKVGMPHVRHLVGKVWEMRGKGREGIARGLYVAITGRRVVILRCFVKKTQKTPEKEIKLALARMEGLK